MRVVRYLLAAAGLAVALAVLASPVSAQRNSMSFTSFIDALNNNDATALAQHVSASFTLTFAGGSTLSGDDAQDALLLLDRPIQVKSVKAVDMQNGEAELIFGSGQGYNVSFTGARGGQLATLTIGATPGATP